MTNHAFVARPPAGDPVLIRRAYMLYGAAFTLTLASAGMSWAFGINQPLGATLTAAAVIAALYTFLRHACAGLFGYAGLTGLALGSAFMRDVVAVDSVASGLAALGVTAAVAIVLPAHIRKSKADYSYLQAILLPCLLGLLLAGVVVHGPVLRVTLSAATVLVFAGFLLHDASRLERGYETNAIAAALYMHINLTALLCQALGGH